MLLAALLSCVGSLGVVKSSGTSQRILRLKLDRLLLKTMSGFLPNNIQYPVPHMGPSGFSGIVVSQDRSKLYPSHAYLHSQQFPQYLRLDKSVNPLQYWIQNFAFNNCEYYHQSSATYAKSMPTQRGRAAMKAKGQEEQAIKDEEMRTKSSDSAGSSPRSSRESSPAHQEMQADQATLDEIEMYESRGVKRHMDPRHSPQKKRSRGHEGDDSSVPPEIVMRTMEMDTMTQFIWQHYEQRHQSTDIYTRKMRLREALYTLMKGVFPYCGVYVVGSSMNGFGAKSSDMDMCLMISQAEIDQKKEATEILRILLKALRTCSFLREIKLIRAKVPILKFLDRISDIEVDLNINNSVGIRNTHLLRAYSLLDWRVSPLVLFVKHWAKSQQINDASQGTISSYSLVLMVIHYLQTSENGDPPVLPSLQQMYPWGYASYLCGLMVRQHKFNANFDIRLLTLKEKLPPYTSPNQKSLGDLFIGFLRYYATKFDFQSDAISIRLGKRLPKATVMRQTSIPGQWKYLCIEEPFDLSNTARSVYDLHVFQRIHRVVRLSHARLQQTRELNSILDQPL